MLGGIEAYGVLGIFLGPVILSIVVAFVQIYQSEYGGQPTGPNAPDPRAVPLPPT
jgi:predicted PurR-regulated permease PerM